MIPGNPRSVADRAANEGRFQPKVSYVEVCPVRRPPCLGCWIVGAAVVSCVVAAAIWAVFAAQVVRL